MKILVLGANGRVGSELVARALERGHQVLAFVHGSTGSLPTNGNLTVFKGDIYNESDIDAVLSKDIDAVCSALGSWGSKRKNVLTAAMQNLVPYMERRNVNRIVSLTGADARDEADVTGIINTLTRPLLMIMAGSILRDGEKHIRILRKSTLNWTVIRSPVMTAENKYNFELVTERPRPWQTVPRVCVAQAMLDCIEHEIFVRSCPFIVKTAKS